MDQLIIMRTDLSFQSLAAIFVTEIKAKCKSQFRMPSQFDPY